MSGLCNNCEEPQKGTAVRIGRGGAQRGLGMECWVRSGISAASPASAALRPHGGWWGWHRYNQQSPASSPSGRNESSPGAPSEGPGSLAGWQRSSWSCLPAPGHWYSLSVCTGPLQSPRGTGGGPGWCCRRNKQSRMVRQGKEGDKKGMPLSSAALGIHLQRVDLSDMRLQTGSGTR
jgi:hypothetical protein